MTNNYEVLIKNTAKKDLKKIKQSQLKSQFVEIINILKIDPYHPSHSFEKLQPKHLGRYSRRINHQHRIVYTVDETKKQVYIYSAWSHYE